jgi:hypothetical protein
MKRIWFCHCLNKRQLRESNSNKDNNHFHNAIRKYGEDSFEVTILDTITETTKEQLDRHLMVLEKTYIEHYDSFNLNPELTRLKFSKTPAPCQNHTGTLLSASTFESQLSVEAEYKLNSSLESAA